LLEPEMLAAVEPDVHLVGTLISLGRALPETTQGDRPRGGPQGRHRPGAADRHPDPLGAGRRAGPQRPGEPAPAPRHRLNRTIRANLGNYVGGTVVPERLIGYARARNAVKKEVVLCIDQSGSMAASVVHSSVFGAVLASMPSLSTRWWPSTPRWWTSPSS